MGVYWIHPDACPPVCPSVCRQGFRNFLKKTIGSIHSIPSIYPYGVNLLTPIHFCVSSLILALWWPNIWPKMGFQDFFEKTIGPIHFIPGIYPYGVSLFTPINFRVPSLILALWWPNIWLKMGFPEFKKNINLYWIFLDEVGIDQSGGILSPFMGTACF